MGHSLSSWPCAGRTGAGEGYCRSFVWVSSEHFNPTNISKYEMMLKYCLTHVLIQLKVPGKRGMLLGEFKTAKTLFIPPLG